MKRALVRSGVMYFFLISTMGETERMDSNKNSGKVAPGMQRIPRSPGCGVSEAQQTD